jgi:hypothetical protein
MKQAESKRKYRVLIKGQNFLLNKDGETPKTGFYTTRFVEAQDAKQAEAVAIELIKSDAKLADIVLNKRGDTPRLHIEEVEEVKRLRSQVGYAFYSEEEDPA